jgi:hypothetical protein
MIENNPDKPWNWGWISQNTNITIEMIEKKTLINHGIGILFLIILIFHCNILKTIPTNHGIGIIFQKIPILR